MSDFPSSSRPAINLRSSSLRSKEPTRLEAAVREDLALAGLARRRARDLVDAAEGAEAQAKAVHSEDDNSFAKDVPKEEHNGKWINGEHTSELEEALVAKETEVSDLQSQIKTLRDQLQNQQTHFSQLLAEVMHSGESTSSTHSFLAPSPPQVPSPRPEVASALQALIQGCDAADSDPSEQDRDRLGRQIAELNRLLGHDQKSSEGKEASSLLCSDDCSQSKVAAGNVSQSLRLAQAELDYQRWLVKIKDEQLVGMQSNVGRLQAFQARALKRSSDSRKREKCLMDEIQAARQDLSSALNGASAASETKVSEASYVKGALLCERGKLEGALEAVISVCDDSGVMGDQAGVLMRPGAVGTTTSLISLSLQRARTKVEAVLASLSEDGPRSESLRQLFSRLLTQMEELMMRGVEEASRGQEASARLQRVYEDELEALRHCREARRHEAAVVLELWRTRGQLDELNGDEGGTVSPPSPLDLAAVSKVPEATSLANNSTEDAGALRPAIEAVAEYCAAAAAAAARFDGADADFEGSRHAASELEQIDYARTELELELLGFDGSSPGLVSILRKPLVDLLRQLTGKTRRCIALERALEELRPRRSHSPTQVPQEPEVFRIFFPSVHGVAPRNFEDELRVSLGLLGAEHVPELSVRFLDNPFGVEFSGPLEAVQELRHLPLHDLTVLSHQAYHQADRGSADGKGEHLPYHLKGSARLPSSASSPSLPSSNMFGIQSFRDRVDCPEAAHAVYPAIAPQYGERSLTSARLMMPAAQVGRKMSGPIIQIVPRTPSPQARPGSGPTLRVPPDLQAVLQNAARGPPSAFAMTSEEKPGSRPPSPPAISRTCSSALGLPASVTSLSSTAPIINTGRPSSPAHTGRESIRVGSGSAQVPLPGHSVALPPSRLHSVQSEVTFHQARLLGDSSSRLRPAPAALTTRGRPIVAQERSQEKSHSPHRQGPMLEASPPVPPFVASTPQAVGPRLLGSPISGQRPVGPSFVEMPQYSAIAGLPQQPVSGMRQPLQRLHSPSAMQRTSSPVREQMFGGSGVLAAVGPQSMSMPSARVRRAPSPLRYTQGIVMEQVI